MIVTELVTDGPLFGILSTFVGEGHVEGERCHAHEQIVDAEARLGGDGPVFGLQGLGHPRRLIFHLAVRCLRLAIDHFHQESEKNARKLL